MRGFSAWSNGWRAELVTAGGLLVGDLIKDDLKGKKIRLESPANMFFLRYITY